MAMDPTIVGTISPSARRADTRRVASADGALDFAVYQIDEAESLESFTLLVADNNRVILDVGTQLSSNVIESRTGGLRTFTFRVESLSLPPGYYVVHRTAKRLTPTAQSVVDYETFPFVIPDTPFTRSVVPNFATGELFEALNTTVVHGQDGQDSYVYISYASDANGADFSLEPGDGLTFIAFQVSNVELDPPTIENFTGPWWSVSGSQGGGLDVGYPFTQVSPSALWIINHNLGYRPTVAIFRDGVTPVEALVSHPSANQTRINFLTAISGTARLI